MSHISSPFLLIFNNVLNMREMSIPFSKTSSFQMCSYCIPSSGKALSFSILLQLSVQRNLTSVRVLPLLGEPFNGQLETEDGGQEDREEREKNQEKEDSRVEAPPEVFTSESTQTFPVRHPERFPSHRPDNLVPPAPQPPRRSRDHNWKQLGTTECSTTCGKGKPVWKSHSGPIREDPGEA